MLVSTQVRKYNIATKDYELMDQVVEVLTVHFEKGTMRVRWVENDPRTYPASQGKIQTDNMSNKSFLEQYSVVENKNA
jgi:hypothetical protein